MLSIMRFADMLTIRFEFVDVEIRLVEILESKRVDECCKTHLFRSCKQAPYIA